MSYVVSLQKHKQEVVADQAVAAALRQQLEDSQQARTDAAQVNMSCPFFLLLMTQAVTAHEMQVRKWGVPGGGCWAPFVQMDLALLCKLAFLQAIM